MSRIENIVVGAAYTLLAVACLLMLALAITLQAVGLAVLIMWACTVCVIILALVETVAPERGTYHA